MVNLTVYFNITVDGQPLDHVSFKLFADKISKRAEIFHALSSGEKIFDLKDFCFHRIIPGFMYQGGDFTYHNGTGSKSIYGEKFDDENFILKHTALASCLWQMLGQIQMVPSFSSVLPRLSG
ncbi:Hypothetical predicted protein [Marmota monax]|uniref:Peptidyl-prolyl cis-trans isomerase n=1 Tax=Marmota monax TaxID=9995 RepID=A0A5E4CXE6_MARMO|nr:Hypothetical predicted protein [Marmota monax]